MDFSLIGIDRSEYANTILNKLIYEDLKPKYILIEDTRPENLANSAYYIDTNKFPEVPIKRELWNFDANDELSLMACCVKQKIPFFSIMNHNCRYTIKVLQSYPVDILIITEGPIIRGPILYIPRYCVMNIHAAPLPQYRGNFTTRFALYNDEPPTVSAHVVTPWIDEGAIIGKLRFEAKKGDSLEDVDKKAFQASAELAVKVLKDIRENGFHPRIQHKWEGQTYRGKKTKDGLQPAMPPHIHNELRGRFERGEYGFFS